MFYSGRREFKYVIKDGLLVGVYDEDGEPLPYDDVIEVLNAPLLQLEYDC